MLVNEPKVISCHVQDLQVYEAILRNLCVSDVRGLYSLYDRQTLKNYAVGKIKDKNTGLLLHLNGHPISTFSMIDKL